MKTFAPQSSPYSTRRSSWFLLMLALLFWLLVLAASALSLILRLGNESGTYLDGTSDGLASFLYWGLLIPASVPAYGTVGAFLAARQTRNPVGWLCLTLALCIALQDACWQFATNLAATNADLLQTIYPAALLANILRFLQLVLPALLLLLFPSGSFLSRRWKDLARLLALVTLLFIPGQCLASTWQFGELSSASLWGPLPFTTDDCNNLFFPIASLLLLVAILSLFVRARRVSSEKQQIKWLLFTLLIISISGLLALALENFIPDVSLIAIIIGAISVAGLSIGLPIAVSLALLSQRRYDIDILINRTLVFGGLTFLLAFFYVGGVIVLQFLFNGSLPGFLLHGNGASGPVTGGASPTPRPLPTSTLRLPSPTPGLSTPSPGVGTPTTSQGSGGSSFGGLFGGLLPSDSPFANIFTTLGIAALFQPLRLWLQRGIDRRFYRQRYEAAQALESFSATLREQIDLDQLHTHILTVVEETMQPRHVSLWLCNPVRPTPLEVSISGSLEPIIQRTGRL